MTSLTFEVLEKKEITTSKANRFIALLKEQGKVRPPSVDRVKQCQKLIFVLWNGVAIGIGAIKPKTPSDFRPSKADLPELARDIAYELGYFYIKDSHRGLGLSSALARLLLRDFRDLNLIATTELHAGNPMVAVLHKSSFHRMGKSWKSAIHTGDLGLFVKLAPVARNWEGSLPINIADYILAAKKIGFTEYPYYITGMEPSLASFVDYGRADLDLKIYLTRLILCRNFSPAGGYEVLTDHLWLIQSFLTEFETDALKPWLTPTIKEALESVLSESVFTRNLLGTGFLFGVVEYYAKHWLGWRPTEADFFDDAFHEKFREMSIGQALLKLKKGKLAVARDLHAIDAYCTGRLKKKNIKEERWVIPRIADRLTLARNTMLHGEEHSFYGTGRYLAVLYILFYLHNTKALGAHSS
jgi:hypothetical protein